MHTHADDVQALDKLIHGFQVSRMLRAVADLGLADKVPARESRDLQGLAAECGVQGRPLLRMLRALAACDVFTVAVDDRIGHTPLSLLLRSDAEGSLHTAARFWTAPGSWQAWGALDVALTGGVPHQAAWQMGRFEYLRSHPEEARVFDAFMAHFPDNRHKAIADAYDFAHLRVIADIGGGNGETLRHVLRKWPQARGLLFDRPDVVAGLSDDMLLGGRIVAESGNFLERVPQGADACLLVRVLHDWPDEDCVRILANCRDAIPSDGRLLIVEQLLEPDPSRGQLSTYLLDMQMMAMFGGGRERSREEFTALLTAAGWKPTRVIPTGSAVSIIESRRS